MQFCVQRDICLTFYTQVFFLDFCIIIKYKLISASTPKFSHGINKGGERLIRRRRVLVRLDESKGNQNDTPTVENYSEEGKAFLQQQKI